MPEISRFFGIVIRMYFDEHLPPHFHASYDGNDASIAIEPLEILATDLSPRALSMVLEWAARHQRALRQNWETTSGEDRAPRLNGGMTAMAVRVNRVTYLGDYRLKLEFTDGSSGQIDFRDWLVGRTGLFAAFNDVEFFRQVELDVEAGTIRWPNGVDLCPDVLRHRATGAALPSPSVNDDAA